MRHGLCGLELHRDEVLLVQLHLVGLTDAEPPALLPGVIQAVIRERAINLFKINLLLGTKKKKFDFFYYRDPSSQGELGK